MAATKAKTSNALPKDTSILPPASGGLNIVEIILGGLVGIGIIAFVYFIFKVPLLKKGIRLTHKRIIGIELFSLFVLYALAFTVYIGGIIAAAVIGWIIIFFISLLSAIFQLAS